MPFPRSKPFQDFSIIPELNEDEEDELPDLIGISPPSYPLNLISNSSSSASTNTIFTPRQLPNYGGDEDPTLRDALRYSSDLQQSRPPTPTKAQHLMQLENLDSGKLSYQLARLKNGTMTDLGLDEDPQLGEVLQNPLGVLHRDPHKVPKLRLVTHFQTSGMYRVSSSVG
jgi:hypothetical protein